MKKKDENIAIEEVKSRLRNEALEKEVIRLKNRSSKQKKKLNKVVFFFCLQAGVLITCFFLFKKEPIENTSLANNTLIKEAISPPVSSIKSLDDVYFKIQIGAFDQSSISLQEMKENLVSLDEDMKDGRKIFTLGKFKQYQKALDFLSTVKQIGFSDAFLISYKNEEIISTDEAIQITDTL